MKRAVFIAGLLVIIGLAVLCMHQHKKVKATEIEAAKALAEQSFSNYLIEELHGKIDRYISNLNIAFSQTVEVTDKTQGKVPISMVFERGVTLCLYFTESMCPPCVETHIQQFKEFEQLYGVNHLRILITTHNPQALTNINKRYITEIPFYHIDRQELPFCEIQNTPIVFIVNDLLYISGVFFSETQVSKNNGKYYENVEKLLQ